MIPRVALACVVALAALLEGCSGVGLAALPFGPIVEPPKLVDPRFDARLLRLLARADAHRLQGERGEAEALIERVLAEDRFFVPAQRKRQDLLRERGRAGQAWSELAALEAERPGHPDLIYLRARLSPSYRDRRAILFGAMREHPRAYWIAYGVAWCLLQGPAPHEPKQAEELAKALVAVRPLPPGVLSFAHQVRERQSFRSVPSKLLPKMRELALDLPKAPRLDAMRFDAGERRLSLLLRALETAPEDPLLAKILRTGLARPGYRARVLALLDAREDLTSKLVDAGRGRALAQAALAEGRGDLARWFLRETLARGKDRPRHLRGRILSARGLLRRLVAGDGKLGETAELALDGVPAGVIETRGNVLRARIEALRALARPQADAEPVQATEVLLRAGLVEEAAAFARATLAKAGAEDGALAALLDEARRFLRFEAECADLIRASGKKRGEPVTLAALVEELRARSIRVLGHDVVGRPYVLRFPFVGELIDPFGPGLPRFFDRYNRHIVLGQVDGHAASLILGKKICERRLPAMAELALRGACREVVLDEKSLQVGEQFGLSDPAGIALWNHYIVDLGAARRWAADFDLSASRVVAEGVEEVCADPIPDASTLAQTRPAQVSWKLLALARKSRGTTSSFDEVLELLRLHERAHLVDAQRFLPVSAHLLPSFWLLASVGFSKEALLGALEGRAECAALAYGADPRAALAHMAGFLQATGGPRTDEHEAGFRRVLALILAAWEKDGAPGAREPSKNLCAQLHLLPPERARAYAREALVELGFR